MSVTTDLMMFPAADRVELQARSLRRRGGEGTGLLVPAEPYPGAVHMQGKVDPSRSVRIKQTESMPPGFMVQSTQEFTSSRGNAQPPPRVPTAAEVMVQRPVGALASSGLQAATASAEEAAQQDAAESDYIDVRPSVFEGGGTQQVVEYADAQVVDVQVAPLPLSSNSARPSQGTAGAVAPQAWANTPVRAMAEHGSRRVGTTPFDIGSLAPQPPIPLPHGTTYAVQPGFVPLDTPAAPPQDAWIGWAILGAAGFVVAVTAFHMIEGSESKPPAG